MESNGLPNRIHVSEETANALTLQGKGHWLTPREDKIVAKGKGELQTYFVNSRGDGKATESVITASSCMSGVNSSEGRGHEIRHVLREEDDGTGSRSDDHDEIEAIGEKLKNRLYTKEQ